MKRKKEYLEPVVCTKDAYLQWVREWKVEWHEIVGEIRDAKYNRTVSFHPEQARWQAQRESLRVYAHQLIDARLAGKVESWKRRCEALEEAEEVVAA
jgi:hypothetical protein